MLKPKDWNNLFYNVLFCSKNKGSDIKVSKLFTDLVIQNMDWRFKGHDGIENERDVHKYIFSLLNLE